MIEERIYYPQPHSETPSYFAAPHGWGASGFCTWREADKSRRRFSRSGASQLARGRKSTCRQERVGRTYVDGNPVLKTDPTGHSSQKSSTQRLLTSLVIAKLAINYMKGETDFGLSGLTERMQIYILFRYGGSIVKEVSKAFRYIARTIDHSIKSVAKGITGTLRAIGRSADHSIKGIHRGITGTARQLGRAIDGGARWLASGGSYSRNKGNDLDRAFGTNFFREIERSDAGRLVTDAWQGLLKANWTKILIGVGMIVAMKLFGAIIASVIASIISFATFGLISVGVGVIMFAIVSKGAILIVEGLSGLTGEDTSHETI